MSGTGARRLLSGTSIVVFAAVVVGAVLRFVGASWGLPATLHPDEWVIVEGAIDLAQRNSFEPSLFLRPDHVEIKLSFLAYSAYALVHGVPVAVAYETDPAVFTFISRLVTAVLGSAMIVVAALIGRRFSAAAGATAAVLFALFPPFILHSHYATPDIPLALASLFLVLALVSYVSKPSIASLLGASAAVSFSIAIKYPGAISAIMIAIVIVVVALRDRRPLRILSHGATAIGGVVGFLFLISPVLFTNISGVVTAIRKESRTEHAGADGLGWGGNLLYYATDYLLVAGILLVLLAGIGVFFSVRKRLLIALPLTLGFLVWIVLGAVPLHWERWGVPMYISPLLFAAIGAVYGYRAVGERWPQWRGKRAISIVVASLIVLNLGSGALATAVRFLTPDARVVGVQIYADAGVTPAETIDEGYSPFVPQGSLFLFDQFRWQGDELIPKDDTKRFVALSSCVYERYADDARYPDESAIYAAIRSQFEPVLDVPTVPFRQGTGIEPTNIIGSVGEIAALTSGVTGCGLEVYRIT